MKRSLEERLIGEELGFTLGREEDVSTFLERLAEDPESLGLAPERVAAFLQRLGREVDSRSERSILLPQRVKATPAAELEIRPIRKVPLPARTARGKSKVRATKVK